MKRSLSSLLHFVAASALLCAPVVAQNAPPAAGTAPAPNAADRFAKWEKEIAAFEAADRKTAPPEHEVMFIGSSTIRLWKSLEQDFPEHRIINRGFGGSQIEDSTHFAQRIVFPCAPRVIFLRAGGNDINAGKSPGQVFEDYKAFVTAVHAKLPETHVIYLSLCPTIARIRDVDKCNELDDLIRSYAAKEQRLNFVDCQNMTVGSDGKPRADLFVADGLHLNEAGYRLLAERVKPFLPAPSEKKPGAAQ